MVEGKEFVGHASNNRALLQHTRVQRAAEHGTPRNQAQPGFCRVRQAKHYCVFIFMARAGQSGSTIWGDPPAYAPLPDCPHDERLTRNEVRRLCSQLGIPVEDFGLTEEDL